MTELPPLPEPPFFAPRWPGDQTGYSAEQMQAYARAAVAAEREERAISIEAAIIALVDALVSDKGWMRAYANAIVRDAIDRVDRPYVPLTDSEMFNVVAACWYDRQNAAIVFPSTLREYRAVEAAVLAKVTS